MDDNELEAKKLEILFEAAKLDAEARYEREGGIIGATIRAPFKAISSLFDDIFG